MLFIYEEARFKDKVINLSYLASKCRCYHYLIYAQNVHSERIFGNKKEIIKSYPSA